MSYFDTLQGYLDNNESQLQHQADTAKEFASEKANSIKEKFDSVTGDIEKWGNVIQGASGGWWMGRKIIRKIRSYTPDEKPTSQGGEAGEFTDAEKEAGNFGDTEEGAMKFADKPEADPDNPFTQDKPSMNKPSDDATGDESSVGRQGTDSSANSNVEPERVSTEPELDSIAEGVEPAESDVAGIVARSQASLARTQATLNKINNPENAGTDTNNPANDSARGNAEEPKPQSEPEGTSGNDADTLNETKDVANETENATSDLVESGTKPLVNDAVKSVVTDVVEKTGVKTGLDIAGETLADAIPVVGEVVAVGTMVAGLFRDIFGKHHEEVKEAQASTAGEQEGIVNTGGFDASAIASRVGAVAGLV